MKTENSISRNDDGATVETLLVPAELGESAEALIARYAITEPVAAAIRTCDYTVIASHTPADRAVGHFANACYAARVGNTAYASEQLALALETDQ